MEPNEITLEDALRALERAPIGGSAVASTIHDRENAWGLVEPTEGEDLSCSWCGGDGKCEECSGVGSFDEGIYTCQVCSGTGECWHCCGTPEVL